MNTIKTNANDHNLQLTYNDDRLGDLLEVLDDLHTATSENALQRFTTLGEQEVLGLLKELVYTAQEAISEIEVNRQQREARKQGRASQPVSQPLPANIVQWSELFGQHIVHTEADSAEGAQETIQAISGTRHA